MPPIIDKNLLSTPKTNLQLLINQQWAYAESLIAEATHLIFVGYSFPETDKHATDFFQRICKYSRPKVVTGCYKGSNARLKKILEGFGKAYELDSNGLESFVSNFNFENFFAMVAE